PIGSWPGQIAAASDSFTTATGVEVALSAAVHSRPRVTRAPSASRYCSVTGIIAAEGRSLWVAGTALSRDQKTEFQLDPSIGSESPAPAATTPGRALVRVSRSPTIAVRFGWPSKPAGSTSRNVST